MNIYSFDVSFSTGVISSPYFTLVVNDHNSTTFKFTFDQDGRHVFKLLYPDNTYYVQDIINDELILGKGVLNQSGNYKFEISLYGEDNRLTTSLTQEFAVRLELVDTDEIVSVDDRVPVLDNLIEETNTILQEAKDGKFDGATFTPNVSESGDLSWSNDKGKENPPTVNIMGPPGEPGAVKMQVVDVLPETGETDTIYLVKKDIPNEQNLYDEYVYANGTWEHIGDTSVDLSDYYTKSETDNKLNEKQNTLTAGKNITIDENNVISASGGDLSNYYTKEEVNKNFQDQLDIYLFQLDTTTSFYDMTSNYVLTSDEKTRIENIINDAYTNNDKVFRGLYLGTTYKSGLSNNGEFFILNYTPGQLSSKPTKLYLSGEIRRNTALYSGKVAVIFPVVTLTINGNWNDDIFVCNSANVSVSQPNNDTSTVSLSYLSDWLLPLNNTKSYTPTSDYHPATKKYVDDSISSAITTTLSGSY